MEAPKSHFCNQQIVRLDISSQNKISKMKKNFPILSKRERDGASTVVSHWTGKKRKRNRADKENLSNSQLVSDEDVIMKDLVFFVLHQKDFVINWTNVALSPAWVAPSVNDRLLYHSGRQVGGWRVEGGGVCYLIKGRFPLTLRWFRGISYLIRAPQVPWALLLSQLLHCLQFQPSDWGLEGGGDLETRSTREGKKISQPFSILDPWSVDINFLTSEPNFGYQRFAHIFNGISNLMKSSSFRFVSLT